MAVEVPAGRKLVFLSGGGPSIADRGVKPDSVAAYGDTLAQTVSTFEAISKNLALLKLEMKDVVKMQVFLVGDPAKDGRIDFAGFMEATAATSAAKQLKPTCRRAPRSRSRAW